MASENQKRVFICCSSFPPEVGGAPGRIYNLAKVLLEAGYSVAVFTSMPNYPKGRIFAEYRDKFFCREFLDGIEVRRLWLIPSNAAGIWPRGVSLFSQCLGILFGAARSIVFGKADVVYVSSPPLISAYLYALLARIGGKKLLVNISDIWPLTATELGALREGSMLKLLRRAERFLYRQATGITGQSNEILAHVAAHGGDNKPVLLYRNLPAPVPVVIPAPSVAGERRIIYAGALGFAQGVSELCRNIHFASLGLTLDIYGEGVEREAIQQLISTNPGCGIALHPVVPNSDMATILQRYDAMLIPLRNEIRGAVPSKLFTAINAGLPVLFCGGGEGAEIVAQSGIGRISPPGDVSALQENLQAFALMDDAQIKALKQHILGISVTGFNKHQQDQAFLVYLERLTGAK